MLQIRVSFSTFNSNSGFTFQDQTLVKLQDRVNIPLGTINSLLLIYRDNLRSNFYGFAVRTIQVISLRKWKSLQPIRFNFDVEFCRPNLPQNQILCLHHFNLLSLYFQSLQSLPNWIQLHTSLFQWTNNTILSVTAFYYASSSSNNVTLEKTAKNLHRMSPYTPASVPNKIAWIVLLQMLRNLWTESVVSVVVHQQKLVKTVMSFWSYDERWTLVLVAFQYTQDVGNLY